MQELGIDHVIGVDVGGTNTDTVLMRGRDILAWHKSPTTPDVSSGVSSAIEAVLREAGVGRSEVALVKIGTTQFLNAFLERDSRKMDKVAVIRLCGPYTQSVAPFLGIPEPLRRAIEGHYAYIEGGTHVDGRDIFPWSREQLKEEAKIIKSKAITSIVLIGVHSPSFPRQENEAAAFLSEQLGVGFDISCSHHLGNAGFLERENTAILNASIRRFARRVIENLTGALRQVLPAAQVFMTLNDGTISPSWYAAHYPLKCFSSGPTNSARGAAFISTEMLDESDESDLLVIDVGGTTTDVCSLLPNGYPKHSAACIKIAGVKTNLSMPQIHSIALGGGSIIRPNTESLAVGPDSVGADELTLSLNAGGSQFTAADLIKLAPETLDKVGLSVETINQAKGKVKSMIEAAVETAKTKPVDARIVLVGGGSYILPDTNTLEGARVVVRPEFFQVANAIGAAIAKVSGSVDRVVVPGPQQSAESAIEDAKREAIETCYLAGGLRESAEIVDLEIIPETYSFNGAFRLVIRAVSDVDGTRKGVVTSVKAPMSENMFDTVPDLVEDTGFNYEAMGEDQTSTSEDITAYVPHIENDTWTLTETDVELLVDGTGVLGVGCMGEATNYLLALKEAIRRGRKVQVIPLRGIKEDDVICPTCWIGSPTAFFERIPGNEEMQEAIYANLTQVGKVDFTHTIPTEIGGPNALEALLVAANLGKVAVDADLMGRAFPRAYMTIPAVHGKRITPAALADGNGAVLLLQKAKDDHQAEDILRSAAGQFGGIASLAMRPFESSETYLFAQNSYSLAWSIGRSMRLARQQKADVASAIVASVSGKVLFRGKVNLVSRQVQNSFTRGSCTILPDDLGFTSSETWLELIFENEILAATLRSKGSRECLAATPDLMAIIDSTGGQAIGITELKYGLRVSIIALRAPEIWHTAEGLARAGPAALGLSEDYISSLRPSAAPRSLFDEY
ncbi:hypothetical protein JX266_011368 [Neoarthrinium moseri]|nr:hypothetical protein JX266_011368 [Neoarthrinium moseri]